MKRLKNISSMNHVTHYDFKIELHKVNDGYCVDDSKFSPMSEALKNLQHSRPLTDEEVAQCYDFKDGKDTGMKVPVVRNIHEFSDIADLTSAIRKGQKEVNVNIENLKKSYERKIKEEEAINNVLNSSLKSNPNPPTKTE